MDWIDRYQLFLFDFDGLLVDTEPLHYKAYQRMFASYGVELTLPFSDYCRGAHVSQTQLRQTLFDSAPQIAKKEGDWDVLYARKKEALADLLREGPVPLMAGAAEVLAALQERGKKHCVVTHSPRQVIEIVRSNHPVLQKIPEWITREDYERAKPDPDSYNTAVHRFAGDGEKVVGFEDSPRGLQALLGASVDAAVFIPKYDYPSFSVPRDYLTVPDFFAFMKGDTSHA